jgi:hypothetical protein
MEQRSLCADLTPLRTVRELLDCAAPSDVPMALVSPARKCVVEAAAAEAEAAAAAAVAAAAAAEQAEEEGARGEGARDAARALAAQRDADSLLQRRAPRTTAAEAAAAAAEGGVQPRARRRPQ